SVFDYSGTLLPDPTVAEAQPVSLERFERAPVNGRDAVGEFAGRGAVDLPERVGPVGGAQPREERRAGVIGDVRPHLSPLAVVDEFRERRQLRAMRLRPRKQEVRAAGKK